MTNRNTHDPDGTHTQAAHQHYYDRLIDALEQLGRRINEVLAQKDNLCCEDIPVEFLIGMRDQSVILSNYFYLFDGLLSKARTQVKVTDLYGRISTRLFNAIIKYYGRHNNIRTGADLTVDTIIKHGKNELKITRGLGKSLYLEMVNLLCTEFGQKREDWL